MGKIIGMIYIAKDRFNPSELSRNYFLLLKYKSGCQFIIQLNQQICWNVTATRQAIADLGVLNFVPLIHFKLVQETTFAGSPRLTSF